MRRIRYFRKLWTLPALKKAFGARRAAKVWRKHLGKVSGFDKRSIRTIKRGGYKFLVGCPRGKYKRKRCKVGMKRIERGIRVGRNPRKRRIAKREVLSRSGPFVLVYDVDGRYRIYGHGRPTISTESSDIAHQHFRYVLSQHGQSQAAQFHGRNPEYESEDWTRFPEKPEHPHAESLRRAAREQQEAMKQYWRFREESGKGSPSHSRSSRSARGIYP